MVKFQLCFDKDKEAEWLNEMARKGYALTGFCAGFYSFDECPPGEYVYQIDITSGFFRVSSDYREFMRDTGVEIVCLWGMWAILRKKAAEGPFVLYTDVESNIEYYKKIRMMFKCVIALELLCLLVQMVSAMNGNGVGMAGFFIVAAITVALSRELMRVCGILAELQERIGQGGERGFGGRRMSGFLAACFLVNGIGYLLPERVVHYELWKRSCHVLALVFCVIGIAHTLWRRRE